MNSTLTVQQRAQQRRCRRFLACWTSEHVGCCRCMAPLEACPREPTRDPTEGCLAATLDVPVGEREDKRCE